MNHFFRTPLAVFQFRPHLFKTFGDTVAGLEEAFFLILKRETVGF